MTYDSVRNRLLAVIATITVIAAMRVGYPVIMPMVVALFIIAAAWPIKDWIDHRLPTIVSYFGTIVILILIVGTFLGVIYLAISQVGKSFYARQDEFRSLYDAYAGWAASKGLPVIGGMDGYDRLIAIARTFLADVYSVLSYLGLVAVIVIMGFPEVPPIARKFGHELQKSERRQMFDAITEIARSFRSYIRITVVTSLITGVASTFWALAIGLDLALIWGVLNFLLNFIPVIGNLVGIIPPTLYAFIQFGGWVMPIVVFVGFIILQFTISNFVYPLLQGRGMSMPPVTIILSLLFWGWLWGFAGALMAVPLTVAIVIVCQHFPSTQQFAAILAQEDSVVTK